MTVYWIIYRIRQLVMVHGEQNLLAFKSTTITIITDRIGAMVIMIRSTILTTMAVAGD